MVAGIVTIVGVLDTILAHLPTAPGVQPPRLGQLPHLPLSWWLSLIALTLLIGVLEKSYRLHREQQDIISKQGTPDLGEQLVPLSQDVLSFFEDRVEIASERPTVPAGTDAFVRWQQDV